MGDSGEEVEVFGGWIDVGVLGGGWTRECGGGRVRVGWTDELVYLVSVGGWVRVCERVFSVGFGPGLDSMSPARSRRSASHAAGTHGWLPKKNWVAGPPERRGKWIQFAVFPATVPPTVAHQPRAGCIRLVLFSHIIPGIINTK